MEIRGRLWTKIKAHLDQLCWINTELLGGDIRRTQWRMLYQIDVTEVAASCTLSNRITSMYGIYFCVPAPWLDPLKSAFLYWTPTSLPPYQFLTAHFGPFEVSLLVINLVMMDSSWIRVHIFGVCDAKYSYPSETSRISKIFRTCTFSGPHPSSIQLLTWGTACCMCVWIKNWLSSRGQSKNSKLLLPMLWVPVHCSFFFFSFVHFLSSHVHSLLTGISRGCLTVRGSFSSLWWGLTVLWVCLTMGRPAFCSRQSGWQSATGTIPLLIWLRGFLTQTHPWTLKAPCAPRRKLRKSNHSKNTYDVLDKHNKSLSKFPIYYLT